MVTSTVVSAGRFVMQGGAEPLWQSTEFIAAIFGAIVGGIIPLVAQALSERRERQRRDYATAIGLFFKLMDIHTALAHVRAHLEEGAGSAKREGMQRSATTASLANPPLPIAISIDEKAVVLSFQDNGLLNDVLNLDRTYNSMIPLSTAHGNMREAVREVIQGVPDARGFVNVPLSREQYMKIAGLRFEMDQLLVGWLDRVILDEHVSRSALAGVVLHIRRLYNPNFELTSISVFQR
jgi:hypothetical protein